MKIIQDKVSATNHIQAFKNVTANEFRQGQILQLGAYIDGDVYEATDVLDADSNKPFILHNTVKTNQDNIDDHMTVRPEETGRGYHLVTGQMWTLPKSMFDEDVVVGDEVEPTSAPALDAKAYVKVATDTTYGFVLEVIEENTKLAEPGFTVALRVL